MKHYPIYKSTRVMLPFCNVCKEMLDRADNSIYPWSCACGKWSYSVPYGTFDVKEKITKVEVQEKQTELTKQHESN